VIQIIKKEVTDKAVINKVEIYIREDL